MIKEPSPKEEFYLQREEPIRSTLLFIRSHLLKTDGMHETMKWGVPYFVFHDKNFCYLWFDKKSGMPYIGFARGKEMTHPALEAGERNTVKILRLDPHHDLPMKMIDTLLSEAFALYQ